MVDAKTTEVTERWIKKYEKRLAAAEKKAPDKHHEVLDDMRIQIIDELATPAFRNDVEKRLQALLDRLMINQDLDRFELVTLLQPLLSNKRMPWGICGLIIEIYNRTIQRAMRQVEDEFSINVGSGKPVMNCSRSCQSVTILQFPSGYFLRPHCHIWFSR